MASDIEQVPSSAIQAPEKKNGIFRRHKILTGLGGVGLVLVGAGLWTSTQEQYAVNDCSDMENVQVDVSAGLLSTTARTVSRDWKPGDLRSVAEHTSAVRGYYVSPEAVVKLNQAKYGQFADKDLAPGVYCLAVPAPQVKEVGKFTFVQRSRPDNLNTLVSGSDGKPNADMLAAIARANADGWAENNLESLPDVGVYPIDPDFVSWVSNEPGITKEAINRTKEQAQELGLIG